MPKIFRAACLLLLCATASAATKPPAAPRVPGADQVKSTTLANGMKVIVWTDRDIPNVALYNWVRVGSRNEVPGITGLAHFFEHMMFNGTSTRAPGEFDRLMEAQGGSNNAFTSDDVTVYQDWIPRSALDLVFDLEGDRLANLSFDPQVIESERGVVYSERRLRTEDSNEGFLYEQLQATAFVAHPYQNPTVGWPADIQGWKLEDLQKFYKTNYAPNNCTLILVGDIGAGKTPIGRRMLDPLPESAYEAALLVIIHSGITAQWLLRRIALQLGVENPAQEKLALLSQLYQRLLQIYESGKKAVVLIDEAQMLETREIMEEFRGLLNLEVPERKLTPSPHLEVGDRVNHDKYGLGTVTASDGAGVRATVTIDFGSAGTVRLMLIGGVPMQKI
jgi:hypothetical protein